MLLKNSFLQLLTEGEINYMKVTIMIMNSQNHIQSRIMNVISSEYNYMLSHIKQHKRTWLYVKT
jgi:hypothetical protein